MAEKTISQLLNEFAQFLGEQDKALKADLQEKITQVKADLLGGDVAANLDTLKELAEELTAIKTANGDQSAAQALTAKLTTFQKELEAVKASIADVTAENLKAAYLRGKA